MSPEEEATERKAERFLYVFAVLSTILVIGALTFVVCGCNYVPEMAKTIDDIETQQAVNFTIDREVFQKETDIHLTLDVLNKDVAPTK